MYQTYIGEKNSLVFPVMCDGYLSIQYRQNQSGFALSDDTDGGQVQKTPEVYGLWDTGSFTIEAIITPYDVNGYGYEINAIAALGDYGVDANYLTKKSFSQTKVGGSTNVEHLSQSNAYLSKAHRLDSTGSANDGYKMSLFWNENVELYLQNTTITQHNQPAEYQVCFSIKADTTYTIRTGAIIKSKETHHGKSIEGTIANQKYHGSTDTIKYNRIATTIDAGNPITTGSDTFDLVGSDNTVLCYPGQKLYANTTGQKFVLIGTVETVSSGTVTFLDNAAIAVAAGEIIYQPTNREAPYVLNSYHIAASFDKDHGTLSIFINGSEVESGKHTGDFGSFNVDPSDCKIGQGSTSYATTETIDSGSRTHTLYSQFFGELHEFAISKSTKTDFESIDTLVPSQRNLLLYYRFEEVDL